MRSLSPGAIALLALAGAVYAAASRFFTLDFIASHAGIALIRSVDHAVHFSLMRMLLGQFCYVVLLIPVTLVLAWLRVRSDSALAILVLYALIMMVTAYVIWQQWSRVVTGVWFLDLFGVIASVAVQMALFVALRTVADKAARRRARAS